MKKLLSLVVLAWMLLPLYAQENGKLDITHLMGDYFVYKTYHDLDGKPFPSNSMYVVTKGGVILIDTPWDPEQCQPLLDSIKKRHNKNVVLVISTHYHEDRTAGLDFFKQKGIKTYTTKQTLSLCKEFKKPQAEFVFSKDTTFVIGEHRVQTFYPGEGHSKDNILVWFEDSHILFGGCFVKSVDVSELGNVSDANLAAWPSSVKSVMKKFPKRKIVIPGHFGWSNLASLEHTLKLLGEKGYR